MLMVLVAATIWDMAGAWQQEEGRRQNWERGPEALLCEAGCSS